MTSVRKPHVIRAGARLVLLIGAVGLAVGTARTAAPRFYPDDPHGREPESQDASKAAVYEIEQLYEMAYNLFVRPGYKPSGTRARSPRP
jgi:hypothetical protein